MGAIRFLRKLLFLSATVSCIVFVYVTLYTRSKVTDSSIRLIEDITPSFFIEESFNTGYTNINGVSNIYHQLLEEGYELYSMKQTDTYVDLAFVNNENNAWRVYFRVVDGWIAFFNSNYESSSSLIPYTTVKKETKDM